MLLFHISIKFFTNKKKLNSVGTSPMDWFYKEKLKAWSRNNHFVTNSGVCKSPSVDFFTQMRRW